MKYISLMCLLIISTGTSSVVAQDQDGQLRVGVKVEPPFIMKDIDGTFYGLSIDLWYNLADQLDLPFEFEEYNDQLGLLRALDFKEIDLVINPMAISGARLKIFDAAQPFFISSLGVATSRVYSSQVQLFLSNLFSLNFLRLVSLLIAIILFFGTIIWLIEKPYNQHQFRRGLKGIFDGIWWSVVTMTTVGYGDKTPRTVLGRTISVAWMFIAIVMISSFTATITSTLTVNTLESSVEEIDDLKNIGAIGVINNSIAQEFLSRLEIPYSQVYSDPEEALEAVSRNEINVFVHDKPVLKYLVSDNKMDGRVKIMTIAFHEQYRSFLAPKKSALVERLNPPLVDRINSPSWDQTLRKYYLEEE